MWVIKSRGKTYYIEHLEADLPFSTKETPDNPHTKGAIKFKNVHVTIDEDNVAHLRSATPDDMQAQRERDHPPTRVLIDDADYNEVRAFLKKYKVDHDPIKTFRGACGEEFFVFDLKKERDFSLLSMATDVSVRLLNANEHYYKGYSA